MYSYAAKVVMNLITLNASDECNLNFCILILTYFVCMISNLSILQMLYMCFYLLFMYNFAGRRRKRPREHSTEAGTR